MECLWGAPNYINVSAPYLRKREFWNVGHAESVTREQTPWTVHWWTQRAICDLRRFRLWRGPCQQMLCLWRCRTILRPRQWKQTKLLPRWNHQCHVGHKGSWEEQNIVKGLMARNELTPVAVRNNHKGDTQSNCNGVDILSLIHWMLNIIQQKWMQIYCGISHAELTNLLFPLFEDANFLVPLQLWKFLPS